MVKMFTLTLVAIAEVPNKLAVSGEVLYNNGAYWWSVKKLTTSPKPMMSFQWLCPMICKHYWAENDCSQMAVMQEMYSLL